jgi:four helix bundle protein
VDSRRLVRSYRDLLVWQKAMDLVCVAYSLAKSLPGTERFALATQMRRSAVSVASNIAEGHGRGSTGDFARHLSFAKGSLTELETQVLIAERLGFAEAARVQAVLGQADEVSRMLSGLLSSLRTRPPRPSLLAPRPSANP